MITFVRTANIQDGKAREATEWALKVAGYINENFGTNISVQRNIGGQVNQLHWVGTYDSMDYGLGLLAKMLQDEGYQQMVAEANAKGLFFANSIIDNYYQSIS